MGKTFKKIMGKICCIPQRYIIGILGTCAIVNAYTTRVSLNIAITQMVLPVLANKTAEHHPDAVCPTDEDDQQNESTEITSVRYDWDEHIQGFILGAFFWGYIISHLPGGILSDKFGAKHVLGVGMLACIIPTLLTPVIINASDGNWMVLSALRVIEGLGQGVVYPGLTALMAKWVPLKERGFIGTLVYTGSNFGTIMSNFVSGNLMAYTRSWEAVFYLWGGVGVIWLIMWYLLCYSAPQTHPFISDKEADYLEIELGGSTKEKMKIPWKPMFCSVPFWALNIAQIGHDWGLFTIVTDLPKYMNDVLKFDIKKNGLWTSIPYVFMCITSLGSGLFCDWLINHNRISVTLARKLFTSIASIGPATFIIVASYIGCDKILAAWMFTIAMATMGPFYCGLKVNALDLAPNFAGTLMAINNGLAATTGIFAPMLAGFLTPNHSLFEWRLVFWITFGTFISTNTIYLIWASGKVQWWNDSDKEPEPEE